MVAGFLERCVQMQFVMDSEVPLKQKKLQMLAAARTPTRRRRGMPSLLHVHGDQRRTPAVLDLE